LALINEISGQIGAVLTLDELLNQATRLVQTTCNYHHVALFLIDGNELRLRSIAGAYQEYFPPDHTQQLNEGINGWVASHGQKLVANDVSAEPRYISLIPEHTITQSELCLPIEVDGQTIGVVDIQSPHLNAFGKNDVLAMEVLTNQIGVAIKNANLYEAARQELAAANEQLRQEIREREQLEATFQEDEEKYRSLIEQSGDAIFLLYGGKFEIINKRFEELFGVTQEMANRPDFSFSNILTSISQGMFGELGDDTPTGAGDQEFHTRKEFTAVDRDGHHIEIELSLSYPPYRGGLATQGIIRDITERKRIEAEKQQAYQQAQQYAAELAEQVDEANRQREIATILAEAVASVSLTLSTDQLLDHILRKLQQLIPYDSASIFWVDGNQLVIEAARGFEADVINQQHDRADDALFREMETQKSCILIENTHTDPRYQFWLGTEKVNSWVGAPLLVAQELIGYLAVDRYTVGAFTPSDVEVVQAFAHQVAQTIYNARLFADLSDAQAQLIQRERLAALGQMAATVAHELRNPLMGIRMGVEYFVRDVSDDDPRRRGATLMQANIDRIDRIIDDILYVARAPEPVLSSGLLRTVIKDELARWELSLVDKNIQCQTRLAADLPPILLDPDQLARLFTNLISNSIDALAGEGTIRIELSQHEQAQVVTFADNGPGISSEHVARIFEPFFTTKSRGTGLGLSIIKQIVEYHRGEIEVWSKVGQGTRFAITLPQIKEDFDV